MLTVAAFVLALAILIVVHEYGHYRVALACGVKVLRFSVGFGKVLYRHRSRHSGTEFVICAFPIGGYVKMLDEAEAPVADCEQALAFNRQPLRARAAIVVAGPLANLALTVLLLALVNWVGVQVPEPVLSSPQAGSRAAQAGLVGGERVLSAGLGQVPVQPIESFDELRWVVLQAAMQAQDVRLGLGPKAGGETAEVVLRLDDLELGEDDEDVLQKIGLGGPFTPARLGQVMAGGAAEKAGLRAGDLVLQVAGQKVIDGAQLRALIRSSVQAQQASTSLWQVERGGRLLEFSVTPLATREGSQWVGKIGAYVGGPPAMVLLRYGPLDGLRLALVRTWELSALTLKTMGKMLIGQASVKNLSGPLTIADYAGKSANLGLTSYLLFLALISLSLGVLNLLPLPVLDGGHLMYYLWEAATGKPVGEAWMERLQRGGIAVLLLMMSIALFNDVNRLFG